MKRLLIILALLAMPLVAYGSDELPLRLAMKACRISFRSPMRELIRGAYIDELLPNELNQQFG